MPNLAFHPSGLKITIICTEFRTHGMSRDDHYRCG